MRVHLGIADASRTPTGPDGGVDVRSRTAIAQVKRVAAQTGRPDIQRLVGAKGRDASLRLLFYSASGYSETAKQYADEMQVALFVYSIAGAVKPLNGAARLLGVGASRGGSVVASSKLSASQRAMLRTQTPNAKPTSLRGPAFWLLVGTVFGWHSLSDVLHNVDSPWRASEPAYAAVCGLIVLLAAVTLIRRVRRVFTAENTNVPATPSAALFSASPTSGPGSESSDPSRDAHEG